MMGNKHTPRNESPETQTKLCGPGVKPLQLSKNPIQVNLFQQSYVVAFEIFTARCDMLLIYYPPTPADSKGKHARE